MLSTQGRRLPLTCHFVLSNQIIGQRVLQHLNPGNTSQLDVDLVLGRQIVEVEEHVQRAKLDASAEIHDVPVSLQRTEQRLVNSLFVSICSLFCTGLFFAALLLLILLLLL